MIRSTNRTTGHRETRHGTAVGLGLGDIRPTIRYYKIRSRPGLQHTSVRRRTGNGTVGER